MIDQTKIHPMPHSSSQPAPQHPSHHLEPISCHFEGEPNPFASIEVEANCRVAPAAKPRGRLTGRALKELRF